MRQVVSALVCCIVLDIRQAMLEEKGPMNAQRKTSKGRGGTLALLLGLAAFLLLVVTLSPWRPTRLDAAERAIAHIDEIRITEVMPGSLAAPVDGRDDCLGWIEVTNIGGETLSLADYGLSNRPDKIRFLFPDQPLAPGERVVVFASGTSRNMAGGPPHANFKLSPEGCSVYLFGPDGAAHDSVKAPPMERDASYALMEGEWVVTPEYSPGYENTPEGHQAYMRGSEWIPPSL